MAKFNLYIDLDYLVGYLRCGHKEGTIEIPDEEVEEFKKDPIKHLKEYDYICELPIVVDDYRIEEYGDPILVKCEEVK